MKKVEKITDREMQFARKRLEWIIGFMIVRYHFVYQLLAMMTKEVTENTQSIKLVVVGGGNFRLEVNPLFIIRLSDEELTYALYHTILHLALHHCTHRQLDLKEVGAMAQDLAVNEIIPVTSGSCEPPDGIYKDVLVSDLKKSKEFKDILDKQTAEWYYDYLREHGQGGEGEDGGEGESLQRGLDDHSGWKQDEIANERVRAKIDEIAKSNSWGDIGGVEKELILAAQRRKINWRNILRQFYGNLIWHDRESTRKRPNRRTGYVHPGSKSIQIDRHLVAVDVSGSISSNLLSQFLAVLNQMIDFVPIDVIQCDCGITDAPKPFDRRKHEYTFKGRGGTNFDPIMQMVNERRYKSVVILTDGQAAQCTRPNAQVVWVLPEGHNPPVEWGKRIHMSKFA
jgi:predicted metal-dependent peptidase